MISLSCSLSGVYIIRDMGILLVPLSLCIFEHSAKSQIAIGKLQIALLQKLTALLLWVEHKLAPF